jgi:hypothetical protein
MLSHRLSVCPDATRFGQRMVGQRSQAATDNRSYHLHCHRCDGFHPERLGCSLKDLCQCGVPSCLGLHDGPEQRSSTHEEGGGWIQ